MKKIAALFALSSALLIAPLSHAGAIYTFLTDLSGSAESPANSSTGFGSAIVVWDTNTDTMNVSINFGGLVGNTTASHIHCCALPLGAVATQTPTFVGFPLGVTSGSYSHLFDLLQASTYRAGFITANGGTPATAEAALLAGLLSGNAYLNIHTTTVPGGEIRGILKAPEPASFGLLSAALVALGLRSRKKVS